MGDHEQYVTERLLLPVSSSLPAAAASPRLPPQHQAFCFQLKHEILRIWPASPPSKAGKEEASCTRRGGHPALPGSAVRLVGGQHAEEMEKVGNAAISESE